VFFSSEERGVCKEISELVVKGQLGPLNDPSVGFPNKERINSEQSENNSRKGGTKELLSGGTQLLFTIDYFNVEINYGNERELAKIFMGNMVKVLWDEIKKWCE